VNASDYWRKDSLCIPEETPIRMQQTHFDLAWEDYLDYLAERYTLDTPRPSYDSQDGFKTPNADALFECLRQRGVSPHDLYCAYHEYRYGNVQSTEVADTSQTDSTQATVVKAENLEFRDGSLSQRVQYRTLTDPSYTHDGDSTAGLADFLSRPVKIHTLSWPESTPTQVAILPWALYFQTPQIAKKLDNFSRIQCKLRLKFVLNASPFYYGSLRACYFPLADPRSTYQNAADQVPFSQVPGVYLEPQNMSSAELELPFLTPATWLDANSLAQFANMGVLQFLQYANLRSANGVVGTGITVTTYAWAEDVRVAGPSVGLALQSDEYEDHSGTISGPATAIANIAGMMEEVPYIGPFAMATQMGATAVAGIAKLFGYSNPPVIDDVCPYQPKTFHAFANVEQRMPLDKLSIDPKNEVTINSASAGVEEDDPLAFQQLLSRESFLQGTLWSNAQAPDTLLWSCLVHPGYTLTNGAITTSPPVSHFSRMFRYWRGSMIYKFRFIKTKYHKGRVIISWDPNQDISGNPDTETTTFTRVVDLEVEDEVEIEVPYKSTYPWMQVTSGAQYSNGAAPVYTYNKLLYNGSLTVRVQNILTGPAASPQIDILVYPRAGPDFQFAVPTDITTLVTTRDPAGVIQSSEVADDSIDQKQHEYDSNLAAVTVGETYSSLRPVLHRTSLSYTQIAGNNTSVNVSAYYWTQNPIFRIPDGVGRTSRGYNQATIAAANQPYSYSPNHPIDWTIDCFVGFRGSVNIHVNAIATGQNVVKAGNFSMARYFDDPIQAPSNLSRNGLTQGAEFNAPGNVSRRAIELWGSTSRLLTGQAGLSLTNQETQAGISCNVPQYNPSRFYQAFHSVRQGDTRLATYVPIRDEVVVQLAFANTTATSATQNWPILQYYHGAGVDFQPIFFLCTPRLFVTALPVPGT
jgi:hypothetical protein